ncbi:MAG: hypothetical protein JSR72_20265 [Proteobacteria bacterium]|nr:hypothetical protein [Pseudomonadota bacterium]
MANERCQTKAHSRIVECPKACADYWKACLKHRPHLCRLHRLRQVTQASSASSSFYIAELMALLFVVVGTVAPALLGLWLKSELATVIFAGAGFVVSVLVSAGYLVLSDIAANTREAVQVLRKNAEQSAPPMGQEHKVKADSI